LATFHRGRTPVSGIGSRSRLARRYPGGDCHMPCLLYSQRTLFGDWEEGGAKFVRGAGEKSKDLLSTYLQAFYWGELKPLGEKWGKSLQLGRLNWLCLKKRKRLRGSTLEKRDYLSSGGES